MKSLMGERRMDQISSAEFDTMCQDKALKIIKYGRGIQPKVFEKDGSTMIKLFYPKKRLISSTRFKPQALRFSDNITGLHARGYNVPSLIRVQHCTDLNTYLVHYQKIEGQNIRALAKLGKMHLIEDVAKLVANLHKDGIIFRSIHLENLLYKSDGSLALIDIADVRFKDKPLNIYLRYRNLVHLFASEDDQALWEAFGIQNFLNRYFAAAKSSNTVRRIISFLIHRSRKKSHRP